MLRRLLSRNADLQKLADDGYHLAIRRNYLIVRDVPYVTTGKEVAYGHLIAEFAHADDVVAPPSVHTVWFTGLNPSNQHGQPLDIVSETREWPIDEDLIVQHQFSRKAFGKDYDNHYDKMHTYAWILAAPAQLIDPDATPQRHQALVDDDDEDEGIFRYIDNASTRASIVEATDKLRTPKVAIIGVGGTGSYILDLLAKVPIKEIHLFDGDELEQHNAFRAPGAASAADINARRKKVDYFVERYDPMRTGLMPHPYRLTADRVAELAEMNFVFIAADAGPDKAAIVGYLAANGIDFIDVGMGLRESDASIYGQARIATVTGTNREMATDQFHVPTTGDDNDNDYDRNIQVADLNALVAAEAVIRFKKLKGFYLDLESEHRTMYTLVDNALTNEGAA